MTYQQKQAQQVLIVMTEEKHHLLYCFLEPFVHVQREKWEKKKKTFFTQRCSFFFSRNRSWHYLVVNNLAPGPPRELWLCAVCLPRVLRAAWGRSAVATQPPPFCPRALWLLCRGFCCGALTCSESPSVRLWHAVLSHRRPLLNVWSHWDTVQSEMSLIQPATIECNGACLRGVEFSVCWCWMQRCSSASELLRPRFF